MIYVDQLRDWGWILRGKRIMSCHLIADTEAELHPFAQRLSLKHAWFQGKSVPHYDLTSNKRALALKYGAKALSNHDFVQIYQSKSRKANHEWSAHK